jgi:hypothetical protein
VSGHGIDVCRCGAVVASCRCHGPHEKRIVCESCPKCRAARDDIRTRDTDPAPEGG